MNRRWMLILVAATTMIWWSGSPLKAQLTGNSSNRNTGTQGGASSGAGIGSSFSSMSGLSLSSRFQSSSSRFTGGSQSAGQTTAGAGAATSGMFGQSATGNRSTGRGGSFGGLGAFGGLGGIGGLGGFGRGVGFGAGAGLGGQAGGANTQGARRVRTHMVIGFQPTTEQRAAISQRSSAAIQRCAARMAKNYPGLKIQVKGDTAVITGTAASQHARDVAERLVRLEPGIWEVQNELIVDPDAPKLETAPK